MKLYLVAYNLFCFAGWAAVLYLLGDTVLFRGGDAEAVWERVELPLKIAQTAAVLEILHSLLRIVRSPLATTFLQVASRIFVLWGITNLSGDAQKHWSLIMLIASWSLAEIPRYLLYAVSLISGDKPAPFPVFWARYNGFWFLYPTGQLGEILQIWTAIPEITAFLPFPYILWCRIALFLYLPLGPTMILFMTLQRKSAYRKRRATIQKINASKNLSSAAEPEKPQLAGIQWPITESKVSKKTGETQEIRSSSGTGRTGIAESLAAVSEEAANACKRERNWRFGYKKHVINTVRFGLETPDSALKIARRGLNYLYNTFEFHRDGKTYSLEEAFQQLNESAFETVEVSGNGENPSQALTVPYKKKLLQGEELKKQLDKWSEYGTIEPDAAAALRKLADAPGWLDLREHYFCLLGATSAMGPLLFLLEHGANILAVDLDRKPIWERLLKTIQSSPGKLYIPVRKTKLSALEKLQPGTPEYLDTLAGIAGANLFTDAPEIGTWVLEVAEKENTDVTVGGYAYLDGELHVRVALAMDMVMRKVCSERPGTKLGFLCSPTDVFVIPKEAFDAQLENWKNSKAWLKVLRGVLGIFSRRMLVKNAKNELKEGEFRICDGLIVDQGPNYALAKRLQHWRAQLVRAAGHTVSSNIAPSTATASVLSNFTFKLAFMGMHHFRPMEVFYQETSNAVMGSLLVHDLQNVESAAHARTPLNNPLELFSHTSWHGGIWRDAYRMDSKGEVALLSGVLGSYAPAVVGVIAGIAYWVKLISDR